MLSETAIRALKPQEKPYKRSDEKGLFMLVAVTGARLWRLKYRYGGKEKLLALGSYPEVSLKRAREKRDEARVHLADGRDPSALRATSKADNFEAIAREWLGKRDLSPGTIRRDTDRLEQFIFPRLGKRPVRVLTAAEILGEVQRIEERGTIETAHRTLSLCSQVMRYAVQTQRAERDVTADMRGALATRTAKHYPAIIEPEAIGGLLRMIDAYVGDPSVMFALRILPYVLARPSELRRAQWPEFDLRVGLWTVPAERMKGKEGERKSHLVPLARQVVQILEEMQARAGESAFLFPSPLTNEKPISNVAMNAALRRMGIRKDEHCPHGFRSTASTRLNELGFAPSDIELQLAHKEQNKVRAAYNRAARLKERAAMMQFWADYLDGLRANKVVEFRAKRKRT